MKGKLKTVDSLGDLEPISVPGNFPYLEPKNLHMIKQARDTLSFKPETDPHFNEAIQQLQMACKERKEPEMYL